MQLKTVPENYIINVPNSQFGKTESNFLLHGLCIKNDSNDDIELKKISFELHSFYHCVKEITYQGEALSYVIQKFAKDCTWLGEGFGARLFLGQEEFYHPKNYSHSVVLKPNQETGIFNEYFVIVNEDIVDKLTIKITYNRKSKEYEEESSILVTEYKNKNEYIFPLEGCFSTCGNHTILLDHRQHYSMEFAVDSAQYNENFRLQNGDFAIQENHVIYGKEIIAIADGEVVDAYNSFPVTSSWVWEEREPYFKQYGALPSQCGNYVTIKHANGEYSFYGHMILGSVAVNVGDKVKKGQVIGLVGHTGMSNCPHLHFQLMDGPDFSTARGLPCCFSNLFDVCGDSIGIIQENNLIVHTTKES